MNIEPPKMVILKKLFDDKCSCAMMIFILNVLHILVVVPITFAPSKRVMSFLH
jgi:hypothetical protein